MTHFPELEGFVDLGHYTVRGARTYKDSIYFTLVGKGYTLKNLAARPTGDGGEFIAVPCEQGKDGKWYPHYTLKLSPETEKEVIGLVHECLNGMF